LLIGQFYYNSTLQIAKTITGAICLNNQCVLIEFLIKNKFKFNDNDNDNDNNEVVAN